MPEKSLQDQIDAIKFELNSSKRAPLTKDYAITTTIGTGIAVVSAVIAATFTYATFQNRLDDIDARLASLPLTEISKKVSFLECRDREHVAAIRAIFADLRQVLVSINSDYSVLEQKMDRQLALQEDQLKNSSCGVAP
ncbi:hypothetical protein [Agrobacterium pusense]|uniref:hypothetical protein n=1 Tax=Agrobacterium pusense TaxID=648995 RepID=UPI003FCF79C8